MESRCARRLPLAPSRFRADVALVASRTKRILGALAIAAGLALVAANLWSIMTRVKEPTYSLQQRDGDFEVRTYGPRVVAETVVQGQWGESGNEGFRRLAGYIFGKSTTRAKIAMTAPVGQREETRKIAMTAPVGQRAGGDGWVVSFTMPEGETLDSLPQPIDSSVVLRELPATRFAVVRFSGRWASAFLGRRCERVGDPAVRASAVARLAGDGATS